MQQSTTDQVPNPTANPQRIPIYCSCCGTQILAMRVGDTLVVKQRRHGKVHTAVVAGLTDPITD